MLKPFRFQQFEIIQRQEVFRVGTDGVLLGALVSCISSKHILEVGTGTGLISLMMAQRNPNAQISAIDINPEAVELSQQNFKNSPFNKRLTVNLADFNHFESEEKFDLITCNPPFFEENSSQKDILARQQVTLNFNQLIKNTSKFLSRNGIFSVIIPKNTEDYFIENCEKKSLFLFRKVNIKGISNAEIKRVILEFSFVKKDITSSLLILETSPRVYSSEYLELTKDFHVFK